MFFKYLSFFIPQMENLSLKVKPNNLFLSVYMKLYFNYLGILPTKKTHLPCFVTSKNQKILFCCGKYFHNSNKIFSYLRSRHKYHCVFKAFPLSLCLAC